MAVAETSRSIRLTWDPPPVQDRNGIILMYTIFIVTEDGVTMEITVTDTSANIVNGIRPFSTYTISISASTRLGQGPLTAPIFLTTPEDGELLV